MALLAFVTSTSAMPLRQTESTLCAGGMCEKLDMKYERIVPVQPGFQWPDAGGYCGSWASQRAMLAIGAWVSQQQVRDHTTNCGGHDSEILSCNIEEAWTNLKIDFNRWDYDSASLPQTASYSKWLKHQLVSGYAVAWMIMWSGQAYPIYNLTAPAGMYGHVEPVIGIQSNHPLDDPKVYDDDVVLHYTDGGNNTVHRLFSSLPGKWAGPGHKADCGEYSYCIGNPYGFGWAAKGFTHDSKATHSAPASLAINPWKSEPDTRSGQKPEALMGTLTATELVVGTTYDIYRWDSVDAAFTYSGKYKKASFTATAATHVYADEASFQSDGTTYYRVVKAE
jgi:hypothetical protein